MVECFALLGHVLARNGRLWGFKLSVLAKPSLEAVQFNFTTKLLFKTNMKWAWLLSWVRFDTYPGGMLKHGIDSRFRVIFPQKVYIISGFRERLVYRGRGYLFWPYTKNLNTTCALWHRSILTIKTVSFTCLKLYIHFHVLSIVH